MEMIFDLLKADEIDCRIGSTKKPTADKPGGISLLLYKDARCDMIRLDKTVGAMNWQREHSRDNANCKVSIWDDEKKVWVSKEDTGVASRTEAEKGLASDSFKRACVNWGIGRELYTAPLIWISGDPEKLKWERFTVKSIGYDENRCINSLTIVDKRKKVVFQMGKIEEEEPDTPDDTETVKVNTQKAIVEMTKKIPERTAEMEYLLESMKELREARGITPPENKQLFKDQMKALIEANLAPNKDLENYTMDELKNLIDAMWSNFMPTGTELRKK
jgi:hypothetical protein